MGCIENAHRHQYLVGFSVNILSISHGAFCGWVSAGLVELQASSSPLQTGPLTSDEVGTIAAMLCLGGIMGTFFAAWFAGQYGRKPCIMLLALPGLMGWWIIPLAQYPWQLILARFIGGFCGGGIFAVVPVYITEISEDSVRGNLGTLLIFACNIGILLAFVLGNFLTYDVVAWSLSTLVFIFLISFVLMPESPQYLINKKQLRKAEKSWRYLRNIPYAKDLNQDNIDPNYLEFQQLLLNVNSTTKSLNKVNNTNNYKLTDRKILKALCLGLLLMWLNQFCGCFAMLNYTATIFAESGSTLAPNMAAIVVGVIQLLGSYIAVQLVERLGRKLLLIISAVGTGLGWICLGAYMYLARNGHLSDFFGWIPVVSFSFSIFISCWGIIPLPFVVTSELLPDNVRNVISMICTLTMWLSAFILIKYLPWLVAILTLYGVMFFFGSCCFFGAILIVYFLPETKGRNVDEILEQL